jgi:hypothetical protein
MDPKQAWKDIATIARLLLAHSDDGADDEELAIEGYDMAGLVVSLDEWIKLGGFCPHCSKEDQS